MFGLFGKKEKKSEYIASVNGGAVKLKIKPGENLLKAALEAGVAWPHDCRVGSCGTCQCVVKEGKIKPLTDFSYVLDGEQLKAGTVLACQSVLKTDIEVEVELEEGAPAQKLVTLPGKIARINDLTHDIKELVVKCEGQADRESMMAGQYAEIAVEEVGEPRSYSFAKAPTNEKPGEFTFYIRHVPGGKFTDWLFAEDRTGVAITLSAPYGHFWLRPAETMMVCVAGGSGMSAINALLEQCVKEQVSRNCVYLFGARTQQDLYCQEEMEAITSGWNKDFSFEYIPVLSEEPEGSGWQGPTGFVTEHLKTLVDNGKIDINGAQGYLCGPPPMIDAGVDLMTAQGMSEDNIYFDKFLDASNKPEQK